MKTLARTLARLLFLLPFVANAQILISDFSDIGTQAFTPFNLTWSFGDPAVAQFSQGAGFISILPVSGGDPKANGSFDADVAGSAGGSNPVIVSSVTSLSMIARLDSGNASSAVSIVLRDSNFNQVGSAQFLASAFTSTFSAVSATFVLGGGGDPADTAYWTIYGDGVAANNFRMSFDNLVAVPEASAAWLIVCGGIPLMLIGAWLRGRRRSDPVARSPAGG